MKDHELTIGFLGAGRLSASLAKALSDAGYAVTAVWNRTHRAAEILAEYIEGCVAVADPADAAGRANLVFICVSDDAIRTVADDVSLRKGQYAVHCSGSRSLVDLGGASQAGAQVGCFHPLQTFPERQPHPEKMRGITIAIEAEAVLAGLLRTMARDIGASPIPLSSEDRPLYHTAATIAANFLVTLAHQATLLMETVGMKREEAQAALLPLMRSALDGVGKSGTRAALTGPFVRGDAGTVQMHVDTLAQRAPEILAAYVELGLRTIDLALKSGRVDEKNAARLRAVLNQKE